MVKGNIITENRAGIYYYLHGMEMVQWTIRSRISTENIKRGYIERV